jgi:membrane-anchored protein YejM (alkaline phosphatase superfamily)
LEILQNSSSKPVFIFALLSSTHWKYYYPAQFEKYKPSSPKSYNAYKNAILWEDYLFQKFIESLKKNNLYKNTVICITGDHGESFGENGFIGHSNKPPLSNMLNVLTHVPFGIYLPSFGSKKLIMDDYSSHVDIMETIFDYLGFGINNLKLNKEAGGISLLRNNTRNFVCVFESGFPLVKAKMSVALLNNELKMTFNNHCKWPKCVLRRSLPILLPDDQQLISELDNDDFLLTNQQKQIIHQMEKQFRILEAAFQAIGLIYSNTTNPYLISF